MNARTLALVCLLALFVGAPALAADIIVDNSCSLHDAIIAANTDAPAGNCPAGSGADRILIDPHVVVSGWLTFSPLPSITSVITVASGDKLYHGSRLRGIDGQYQHALFDVASGGHLVIDMMNLRYARAGAGGFLVVRRGGTAVVTGDSSMQMRHGSCDNAIWNEGSLTVNNALIFTFNHDESSDSYGFGSDYEVVDPAVPDTRAIVNNGGTMTLHDAKIWLHPIETGCGTAASPAAISRPAPECKLEPQLQVGEQALRRGGSYSNLRAEAGIRGERVGRIEVGTVVDVLEGPVEADSYNWYRVMAADEELEGWVAEAPARSFNCAYYFVSFSGELPPEAPEETPERQQCDMAEELAVGGYAIIAAGGNINYRAEAGLDGARRGTLAAGTVLELLDGPEEADGYEWWQIGNVLEGIEGWVAQGGAVGGECLRWLLPLETEDDMDESDEMMDDESDTDEDADMSASDDNDEDSEENADEASE